MCFVGTDRPMNIGRISVDSPENFPSGFSCFDKRDCPKSDDAECPGTCRIPKVAVFGNTFRKMVFEKPYSTGFLDVKSRKVTPKSETEMPKTTFRYGFRENRLGFRDFGKVVSMRLYTPPEKGR